MLRDSLTIGKFQQLAIKVSKPRTQDYLKLGYGMRALQIMDSHSELSQMVEKSGGKTLAPYEATNLNILLNAFYLNLIGAIDNLAWALQHEFNVIDGANEGNKKRNDVGLFSKKFQEALKISSPEIVNKINEHREWFFDLKKFRDPAAHRIPLYCARSVIRDEHREDYRAAEDHFLAQDYFKDRDGYMNAQWELGNVGAFEAIFVCYSESFDTIIYPLSRTVEQDYRPFWNVSDIVHQCFEDGI
jgi:hypothetical protein